MVNKLFGKKLGMTRYFLDQGRSVPATVLEIGPCVVIQKKSLEKDGYAAIQVGWGPKKERRTNKPLLGHFKAAGKGPFSWTREIRVDDPESFTLGQEITSDFFGIGDRVQVRGLSKGRGFSGVVRRWGFGGGRQTHGSRTHRIPGSIGASATPGRVLKGRKLPGRMGNQHVTIKNLLVLDVRPEAGLVVVRGAVPGPPNNIVEILRTWQPEQE